MVRPVYAKRRALGMCGTCGAREARKDRATCVECAEGLIEAQKRRDITMRTKIFGHYGTSCVCCGEDTLLLLTLDHIDNNGSEHRKSISTTREYTGRTFYRWLLKNGFIDGLQTMCWNCNVGKQLNGGVCPHKER